MKLRDAVLEAASQGKELCASISSQPGKFGTTVHNAGYKALGLNNLYIACAETDIKDAISVVRGCNIRGLSVSMPFKQEVIEHLDGLHQSALKAGAVNTVVNTRNFLMGYNTDVEGFTELMIETSIAPTDRILVIGSGGVSRAVLTVLADHVDVCIASRNNITLLDNARDFGRPIVELWRENDSEYDVLINCTPIGMGGERLPVELTKFKKVVDVIVQETPIVREARARGIPAFSGKTMALGQAAAQFKLYTGKEAPLLEMRKALET